MYVIICILHTHRDRYVIKDRRLQPLAALLSRVVYFRFPKWRRAPEVNTLLRFSKLPCAARSANVPYETKLNYGAARLEYNK